MANPSFFAVALFVFLFALSTTVSEEIRTAYIVHMSKSMKPLHFTLHKHWYTSLINKVTSGSDDRSRLLYTYDKVLHGFAAKLSSAEAAALESMDDCLAVIPSSVRQIHTTHSPQFLGLGGPNNILWPPSQHGKDVIVGVIDSGIWPESESFDDRSLGPVPAEWKGVCQSGEMFNSSHCNRKIIGARYFFKGYEATIGKLGKSEIKSARDTDGHGTHCASTAAGSAVGGVSFNGFANGTAIGMAPQARLAVYKVLWANQADDCDVAAAMEMAIAEGVDIISMSIGHRDINLPFYQDSYAIGAFKAMRKGVSVSFSASNNGPVDSTITNTAPWVITVGASSMDRRFPATVTLGNLEIYRGSSLSKAGQVTQQLPLVYISQNKSTMTCGSGLDPSMVKGKIVLCDLVLNNPYINSTEAALQQAVGLVNEVSTVAKEVGVTAIILASDRYWGALEWVDSYDLPFISVSFSVGERIKRYINSTLKPTAVIKPKGLTVAGKAIRAPLVASFSARGPSLVFPDILKPDLIAPGVNILAAYTGGGYKLESGTSMSCPHVSGLAALIRSVHPSWSPAAIKSALMTSAYVHDNRNQPIRDAFTMEAASPFALGAGHVNPVAAIDPGFVYDMGPPDYIQFLCSLNYTTKQIGLLMEDHVISCPVSNTSEEIADLNYPSFSLLFNSTNSTKLGQVVRTRTVTNVGAAHSTYKVRVKRPSGIKIRVEPRVLEFTEKNEKLQFRVRFESVVIGKGGDKMFGEIAWECVRGGTHVVRSPIVVVRQGN
ncbi:hypothetical protein SUGI_0125350 [Cryptomeria japonica]|uniref:subtilisin-like protease SBT1.7 n=1 Tax=Cryptomeria japonica TaxID=3369 RepID=UPI002408C9EF|nr:subtilisin-like protease SBT1.7 [Cryptomeria japonica]GLJ10279.1 hypothetical protein SUGI_0125350 [Cryptomeria japonica]